MGFVAMGSSLGGTILPIAAKNLLPRVGSVPGSDLVWVFLNMLSSNRFAWTMRCLGFILLAILGASNLVRHSLLSWNEMGIQFVGISSYLNAGYLHVG
jgi:MFS transporter, MCT family, solute carrier family 16 (monocarboxylic acid transporters), member 10